MEEHWLSHKDLIWTLLQFNCLAFSGCCGRTSVSSGGSFSAGDRLPSPGSVCVFGGGGSHQGSFDPNRQVLGGAEGERSAAWWTAGGKLFSPAEVQNEPRGGIYSLTDTAALWYIEKIREIIINGVNRVLIFCQVQASLSELYTNLEHPIKSCTSSSETYKALQNHMVLFLSTIAHFAS